MARFYVQSIFDTGLGSTVRYVSVIPTTAPNPADTDPVGVGPFNAATHRIEASYDNPTQDALGGVLVQTPMVPNTGDAPVFDGAQFDADTSGSVAALVYDSGAPPSGALYDTWADLYAVAATLPGMVVIELRSTLVIPAGSYSIDAVKFRGIVSSSGAAVRLEFSAGCTLDTKVITLDSVQVVALDATTPPISATDGIFVSGTTTFAAGLSNVPAIRVSNTPSIAITADALIVDSGVGAFDFVNSAATVVLTGYVSYDNTAFTGDAPSSVLVLLATSSSDVGSPLPESGDMPGLAGTYQLTTASVSSLINYDDSAAQPAIGVSRVQTALDTVKGRLTDAIVFSPSNPSPSGNTYTSWANAYAAVALRNKASKVLYIDDTYAAPSVSAGSWDVADFDLRSYRAVNTGTAVNLAMPEGAVFSITTAAPGRTKLILRGVQLYFTNTLTPNVDVDIVGSRLVIEMHDNCGMFNAGSVAAVTMSATSVISVDMLGATDGNQTIDGTSAAVFDVSNVTDVQVRLLGPSCIIGALAASGAGFLYADVFHTAWQIDAQTDISVTTTISHYFNAQYVHYDDNNQSPALGSDSTQGAIDAAKLRMRYALAASTNTVVLADAGTPEVSVGGFTYDPADDVQIFFEATLSAPTATVTVRLYDMGAPGTWEAGTLRSEITVTAAQGRTRQQLTPEAVPGVNTDEIDITERIYQLRVVADAAEDIEVFWVGLKVN